MRIHHHITLIRTLLTAILVIAPSLVMWAQDNTEKNDTVYNIVEEIQSRGVITIEQPEYLQPRMQSDSDVKYNDSREDKLRGKDRGDERTRYSLQIFSENKGQSSKKNAEYRKRIVEQRMPGMRGNIVYDSPYWRVRVGSFRTEGEARAAERELKSKFPSFANEIRIVRIRVK